MKTLQKRIEGYILPLLVVGVLIWEFVPVLPMIGAAGQIFVLTTILLSLVAVTSSKVRETIVIEKKVVLLMVSTAIVLTFTIENPPVVISGMYFLRWILSLYFVFGVLRLWRRPVAKFLSDFAEANLGEYQDRITALVLAGAAACCYLAIALGNNNLVGSDLPTFVSEAARKEFGNFPQDFVSDYYPFGWPGLLALGNHLLGGGYVLWGKIFTAVAGGVSVATILLISRMFVGRKVSFIIAVACATSASTVWSSIIALTDPIWSASILLFLLLFARATRDSSRLSGLFAAGVVLGLSYLIRFTAITLVPGAFLVAVLLYKQGSYFRRVLPAAVLILGFILGALPQLGASAMVTGNPLYNQQVKNMYRGVVRFTDTPPDKGFLRDADVPHDVVISRVIARYPKAFAINWANNFFWSVPSSSGMPWFVWLSAAGGLLLALANRRQCMFAVSMAVAALSYVGVLSFAFILPRFLIWVDILLAMFAFKFILVDAPIFLNKRFAGAFAALFVVLVISYNITTVSKLPIFANTSTEIESVNRFLDEEGVQEPTEATVIGFGYRHTHFFLSGFYRNSKEKMVGSISFYDVYDKFGSSVEDLFAYLRDHSTSTKFVIFPAEEWVKLRKDSPLSQLANREFPELPLVFSSPRGELLVFRVQP